MAAFDIRANLDFYIADIMHRSDIPNTGNGFRYRSAIELASERIGTELRSNANEARADLTPETGSPGLYLLPEDFREMRQVYGAESGVLLPLNQVQNSRLRDATANFAVGYLMLPSPGAGPGSGAYEFQVKPETGETINIDYWQRPAELRTTSSTNPVLTIYGQLYLYCSMIFMTQWSQGFEQSEYWEGKYQTELEKINRESNKARYGVGLARSAPARFYNSAPSRAM